MIAVIAVLRRETSGERVARSVRHVRSAERMTDAMKTRPDLSVGCESEITVRV